MKLITLILAISITTISYSQCPLNEGDFTDGGTFSGNCLVDYGGTIQITGDVIWTGGTMDLRDADFNGFIITSTGSLTIQGGTFTLNDADGGNDASLEVESGGELIIENGATLNVETDIDINGTATVESGGNLTITNNGEIEVTGVLDIYGTVTTAGTGGDGNLEAVGGTINIYDGGYADVSDDLKAYYGGTIYVETGGEVDVADNMVNAQVGTGTNPSTGTFIIDGEVNVTDNVTIIDTTPDSSLSGAGTIVLGGTFEDNEGNNFACSGGVCTGLNPPLPVELLSFSYEHQSNILTLTWSTATELNNKGFFIERSYDGVTFERIGFVSGNGTTNTISNYSFTDAHSPNDRYYRLYQEDYDGTFEYLPTLFIPGVTSHSIEIYPNPIVDRIHISGVSNELLTITLLNTEGKKIYYTEDKSLSEAEAELNLLLPHLPGNGIYLLTISNESFHAQRRIVKK